MSSSPPTTLGKYQIIREIARSNDIVYEAYDPLMNRRVALKELALPSGATDQQREDRVKRFLREARAAGSLAHPGIMTVYEVGDDAGRYFIAMEYLEGKTLRNEIDVKGFLSYERAIEIADAILDALDYAHSKGVIHRDIKPDNIQLLPDGSMKLTDFGIARLTFEPNLTMDGQVFGTPSYMSPEQVVGRDLDARSDLFSVGVVLYEMLSGTKPFPGDSVVSITYAIMNKQPDRPQQVGYALWPVIERALDKSPQMRFRDAGEMKAAVAAAIAASQSVVIDPTPPPQMPYLQPYGAPSPTGQPVYPPPMYSQQVPIYYVAPKPRKPILTAKGRAILGQLFAIFVSIGAILGVSYIFIEQLSNKVTKDVQGSIERGFQRSTAASASSVGPEVAGVALWKAGKHAEAELSLRQAIEGYPSDPRPFRALGSLQADRAGRTTSLSLQMDLDRQAGHSLDTASTLEKNPEQAKEDRLAAARAYLRFARGLIRSTRRQDAREVLYQARRLSREDEALRSEVENLLNGLRGF